MKLAQVVVEPIKWMRPPNALRYSGLSPELLELGITMGVIKSYTLRQRKVRDKRNQHAIQLINVESLDFFIEHFAELYTEQEAAP